MLGWLTAYQAQVIGVILMLVLGPAVGNYACSVVYRLPRGKTPFERHPFCGHCNADLKPIDLFPVLSWCLTRGRCRYCRGAVPAIYTLIELGCAAIFIAYFLAFGMGEQFLLCAAFGVFTMILAAIQWQQGWVSASVYGYALTCVALLRTWQDGTIFGWLEGGIVALVLMLLWHRLASALSCRAFLPYDAPYIWWITLMATVVPMAHWLLLAVPLLVLTVFRFASLSLRPWVLVPITVLALYLPLVAFQAIG